MAITEAQQRKAAKEFIQNWTDKGYEKGESQPFWLSLLKDVLGVEHPENFIKFEEQVRLDHTSFIDGYIDETKVMIEQKGSNKNLKAAIKQSDGTMLTPFQQAKRYITELPLSKHPRYVVTCNFKEFYVYDMERPNGEPEIIELKNLEKEYYRLSFLVESENIHLKKEMEVSIKAGEIVGLLYEALLKQYINKDNEETLKSLNKLCVRLVFCLYAEDAGIFGHHNMFLDYLKQFETKHLRKALIDLFKVLDTKGEERDPYMDEDLKAFPYVNGGLFADEDIEIPNFTDEIKELLLTKASADFDWSGISPTIFGAVFESTLNPQTRRKGGMHYTSIENIHKVIDPLFLNDLEKEFEEICTDKVIKSRDKKLKELQNKIAGLTFLDPACGSGNFLTETYISLRKLENKIIYELNKGQIKIGAIENPIKVTIGQFYGIEINDFAVTVAKTALWIAESQMLKQTEDIVHMDLNFLPLKTYTNIVEGNALRLDWNEVVPKENLNYIMGNPPFVGANYMTSSQREDMDLIFKSFKKRGKLDFVACWYKKAVDMINKTNICCALVSTNSITQGEQVAILWKPLFAQGICIDFAHRTFRWDSESNSKAHVHCVIVGFSTTPSPFAGEGRGEGSLQPLKKKELYTNGKLQLVDNINAYLIDAPNIFTESRNKPLCSIPQMSKGSQPTDGGNLLLNEDEKNSLIKKYPQLTSCIKLCIGADEYINNKKRYCLWLKNISPSLYKNIPDIKARLEQVKCSREASPSVQTREKANIPYLFTDIRQPDTNYLIIPSVSSERRKYIPIGFMKPDIIATNLVLIIPNATLYHFGILTSNVHMAWMRAVCGRLKSDYRYSKDIVYNNFPWPCQSVPIAESNTIEVSPIRHSEGVSPKESSICSLQSISDSKNLQNIVTENRLDCFTSVRNDEFFKYKSKIEQTAQGILDARALYPDCSLADLYDELTMPPELRKAHQNNDKAVMEAYGFYSKDENGKTHWFTESETVAELMKMYQELTK